MNKILILLIVVGYGIAGTGITIISAKRRTNTIRRNRAKLLHNNILSGKTQR